MGVGMDMPSRQALQRALRQLGLAGMEQTVDARVAEAEREQLSHAAFLRRLLGDEIQARAETTLRGRLLRVGPVGCSRTDVVQLRAKLVTKATSPDASDAWLALLAQAR
jgi:hypothetical protein